MKLNVAVFVGILFVLGMTLFRNTFFSKAMASETCPDSGGWIKIDSGDLGLYPVIGATQYCFKAGNWSTVSTIPTGGFGQEGPCNQDIKNCDLSHWSYYIDLDDPTSTPTATAIATATSTAIPTVTPIPTDTPCDGDCKPTPTPTPEPTVVPTEVPVSPSCSGDQHLDASGRNCVEYGVPGAPEPSDSGTGGGQVLGASTMAGTGVVEDAIFNSIFTLGSLLTSFGIMKNGKKKS